MLNIEAQEIPFSFDQPDAVLRPLLAILQQALREPGAGTPGEKMLLNSRQVLIIDAHKERGHYLVMLLEATGYRSLAVMTALEAFTLFLRGAFVPLAIILGQEDSTNRLFLQRLLQQVGQKYTRDVPLIRLRSRSPRTIPLTTSPLTRTPSRSGPLPTIPQTPLPPSLPHEKAPSSSSLPAPAPRSPAPPRAPAKIHLTPQTPPPPPKVTSPLWPQESAVQKERAPTPKVERKSLEGHEMGRYRVVSLIGEGAFGATYRAYDRLREQDIALKAASTTSVPYLMMEGEMEEVSLFQQEKDLLGGLEHPHIIPVLHYGRSYVSGSPFIYKTMRFCTEGSLGDWLRTHGGGQQAFSLQKAAHIILQVGETLQFLHEHNITYQNFKLSNLLISAPAEDLDRLHLLLTDFAVPQDGSFFPVSVEAFEYLAPERWKGQASPASDQYGLAVLAYKLLTGRPPFQGTTEQIMRRLHTQMQPQPPSAFNPALPAVIDNVLLRALAKKPEDRFASISLFLRPFQFYRPS